MAGARAGVNRAAVAFGVSRPTFYQAEAYHQDYHNTHSVQYRFYRWTCGRDARLREVWGDS